MKGRVNEGENGRGMRGVGVDGMVNERGVRVVMHCVICCYMCVYSDVEGCWGAMCMRIHCMRNDFFFTFHFHLPAALRRGPRL